jgi:hypothetical protein
MAGCGGLVLASIAIFAGWRLRRSAACWAGVDATNASGCLTFADGATVHVAEATRWPDRPIVVATGAPLTMYRENAVCNVRIVHVGTVTAIRGALEARARGCATTALVAIMLTCTPLAFAAFVGLI